MNKPSLEQIAAEYGPKITSLCRKMIRNDELASDAAQDIWVEILKSLNSFKGHSSLSTWIYTIARRRILKSVQKDQTLKAKNLSLFFKSKEKEGMPEMMEIPQEDRTAWIHLQCGECIRGILHCLEPEARLIYLLRAFTPLKYEEISLVMKKEPQAIRQIFSRASRKINNFLSGNCCLYNPQGNCRCKMKKPLEIQKSIKEVVKLSKGLSFIRNMEDLTNLKKNATPAVTKPLPAPTKPLTTKK